MNKIDRDTPEAPEAQKAQQTKKTQHPKNQKNYVISFRVNNDEKKLLECWAKNSGDSISTLVRKNLDLFKSMHLVS